MFDLIELGGHPGCLNRGRIHIGKHQLLAEAMREKRVANVSRSSAKLEHPLALSETNLPQGSKIVLPKTPSTTVQVRPVEHDDSENRSRLDSIIDTHHLSFHFSNKSLC